MRFFLQFLTLIFSIILLITTFSFKNNRNQQDAPGHIAFISDRTGEPRIHIMSADGTLIKRVDELVYVVPQRPAVRWFGDGDRFTFIGINEAPYQASILSDAADFYLNQVTNNGYISSWWTSPNQEWIMFHGGSLQNLSPGLYRANIDGSNPIKISDSFIAVFIQWLDDNHFVFLDDGDGDWTFVEDLYVMSGNGDVVFTKLNLDRDNLLYPITLIDEKWFFYEFDEGLYRYNLATRETELLVDKDMLDTYEQQWIIGQHTILFLKTFKPTKISKFMLYDTNEHTETQLMRFSGDADYFASRLSPNHEWFLANTSAGFYSINLSTHENYLIKFISSQISQPTWSGDSQWIAFQAEVDGNLDIFRVRPDGTDLTNLTHHPANDTNPSWSPFVEKTWHPTRLFGASIAILSLVLASYLTL